MDWIQFGIGLVTFIGLAVGGFFYIKSEVAKARASELKDLADARGERINDLEAEISRMNTEWRQESKQFKADIARLEGRLEAYQSIKAEEIAVEAARLLQGGFPELAAQVAVQVAEHLKNHLDITGTEF